jgi:NAD(P)-dependent dehydrogenase (short-subunit alcohol dehydrogenase family)
MSLLGQRVVVVGGTTGIGFAVAEGAARDGAAVVVASRRRVKVDAAVRRLPEGTEGHVLDVTDEAAVRDFFAAIGGFDHLVYTAGEAPAFGPLATTDLTDVQQMLSTRLLGVYAAVKYATPQLSQGGSITLTTGTLSLRPSPGSSTVVGAAGAVETLTRALAVELAPLRVNAVQPGVVRTDLLLNLPEDLRDHLVKTATETLPVGRIGEPEDVAEAYLYLMRGGYSTGTIVRVDGGGVLV